MYLKSRLKSDVFSPILIASNSPFSLMQIVWCRYLPGSAIDHVVDHTVWNRLTRWHCGVSEGTLVCRKLNCILYVHSQIKYYNRVLKSLHFPLGKVWTFLEPPWTLFNTLQEGEKSLYFPLEMVWTFLESPWTFLLFSMSYQYHTQYVTIQDEPSMKLTVHIQLYGSIKGLKFQ